MTQLIDLAVEEEGWLQALPNIEEIAETAANLALDATGLNPAEFTISLLACSDSRIAELNIEFRAKSGPTNVLSWPSFDLAADTAGQAPAEPPGSAIPGPMALGDVAIALQTCLVEAESMARPLKFHVMHLILHGCLHLLGYDHETAEDAALMEGLETRALLGAGHPDPYV